MGRGNMTGSMTTGGQGMGAAHASLTMDISGLVASAQQARQAGPQIEAALNGIDAAAKDAQASVESASMAMTRIGESGLEVIDFAAVDATRALEGIGPATEQAAQQAGAAAQELGDELLDVDRAAKAAAGGIRGIGSALGIAGIAAATAVVIAFTRALAASAVEMARVSATSQDIEIGFNRAAARVNTSADEMLASMRRASRGMIADTDLQLAANRSMLLGVAEGADELAALLDDARVRSVELGRTTQEVFERMIEGIGRLSSRQLREIGIIVDAQTAYENYAASIGVATDQLTEHEQRAALLAAVLEQSRRQLGETGDEALTNAQKFQRYDAAASNAADALGRLFTPAISSAANDLANAIDAVTNALNAIPGAAGGAQAGVAAFLEGVARATVPQWAQQMFPSLMPMQMFLGGQQQRQSEEQGVAQAEIAGQAERAARESEFRQRQLEAEREQQGKILDAQVDYHQSLQSIDRNANRAVLQATDQYSQQRADTIASYERSIAREAEDFARQRARAVAQHEQQIARIRQDSAEREANWARDMAERIADIQAQSAQRVADWQADHEERIAKIVEDAGKRREDIERDYARSRERAERQHRNTLLDAASRLDARAVAQEQRRWSLESTEQEQAHQEQLAQEAENLEERLAQEQAAHQKRIEREARSLQQRLEQEQRNHQKRLEEARKADERRLEDMQRAFDERIEQEDIERGIRLARQAEDHARQLQQMAAAQALRMQQIREQQAEQRQALNDAFEKQLDDLGLYNMAWRAKQREEQDKATELFQEMWDDWRDTMQGAWDAAREQAADFLRTPFEEMRPDPGLGMDAMGSAIMPARTLTSTSRSTQISIATGAIVINEAHRPGQTGEEIEQALIRILERAE